MQPWALISPTSRGIGLEVARRLLKTTEIPIVATARKDLDKTREQLLTGFDNVKEDRLHVLKLDVLGTELRALPTVLVIAYSALTHYKTNPL